MNCSDLIATLLTDSSKSSLGGTITAPELNVYIDIYIFVFIPRD